MSKEKNGTVVELSKSLIGCLGTVVAALITGLFALIAVFAPRLLQGQTPDVPAARPTFTLEAALAIPTPVVPLQSVAFTPPSSPTPALVSTTIFTPPSPLKPALTPTVIPPTGTLVLNEDSATVETYDFENQQTALPDGMMADLGTLIDAPTEVWNKYELDSSVSRSGAKSLKLSSDISTTRWYKIARQIPSNYGEVFISYFAKGNNIRKEGKQFDVCYVGFVLTDSGGKNEYLSNDYSGTFGWRYGEQRLTSSQMRSARDRGSKIEFRIACFKSGEFWIDDLRFEFSPP